MTCNLVYKQLHYTYCPISHELKAIKLGRIIECHKRNVFLQKKKKKENAEYEAGRLVSNLILFFKKSFYEVNANLFV